MTSSLNRFPSRERLPQVSVETLPRHFPFLKLLQCPSLLPSFLHIPRPVSLSTIPGITQLTGYIAPVLCYRADRQRRSHCSPNLPALHIQVEPKQILSHIALGHLGQQLPGKGQKGEARQDAGLTRRPSPALPASILLLKTPIHIFRTGPARRHGLYVERRTM